MVIPALLLFLGCGPQQVAPEPAPTAPIAVQGAGQFVGAVWTPEGFVSRKVTWEGGVIRSVEPVDVKPGPERLTPGLVDAHAHPAGLGRQLAELDLTDLPTLAATLAAVKAHPARGGWVLGRGWDQNDWSDAPEGGFPSAADLDAVTTAPAMLRRIDGHAAWLNHAALEAAGITADTPDPPGGRILRDGSGAPTGVLVDNAMDLVKPPPVSEQEAIRRLKAGLQRIADVGLTGVHDAGADDATLARYVVLDAAGELPIRLTVYAAGGSEAEKRLTTEGPWHGDRLSVVGVKLLADGALGSRGAWLSEPYADEAGHVGLKMLDEAELAELATRLVGAGSQLAVHAIGDAAIHQVLDAYEVAREAHPDKRQVPLRVEHVQVVRPEDVPRFAALDVVASMQPTHCTSDMPWAPERLGPERTGWAYRWRDLQAAGATLAFGSDFPVEKPDVALGLWSATRRTGLDGEPEGGWSADQAVSVEEAIRLFSEGAARAAGQEWRGLEVGAPADLVVWRSHEDRPWEPLETWVAGARVDSRGAD